MQTGELTHRKFGTTSPQFFRKSDRGAIKNRLELWQIILHPVKCRLERLTAILQLFTTKRTEADSYRVEMTNGTGNFRNFQISRKKGCLPFTWGNRLVDGLCKWKAKFLVGNFRLGQACTI